MPSSLDNVQEWLRASRAYVREDEWRTVRGAKVRIGDGEDLGQAMQRHRSEHKAREQTKKALGDDYRPEHSLDRASSANVDKPGDPYQPDMDELAQDMAKGSAYPAIKDAMDAGHINYRTGETYANAAHHGWLSHHEIHQRLRAHRVLTTASKIASGLQPQKDPNGKVTSDMARYYGMHLREGGLSPMKVRALAQQYIEQHYRDHPEGT